MKRSSKIVKVSLLVMLISVPGLTQPSQTSSPEQLATIYIYRNDLRKLPAEWLLKTYPIKFGRLANPKTVLHTVAHLRNKRYFMMRLTSGKCIFDTRLSERKLELEVLAGESYFLYLDRGNVCPPPDREYGYLVTQDPCDDRAASVIKVISLVGQNKIKSLLPIEQKDIKDPHLAIIPKNL